MTMEEIELLPIDGYYTLYLQRNNVSFIVKLMARFRHVMTGKYCVEVETPQRDNYIVSPEELGLIDEETAIKFSSLTGYKKKE